MEAPAGGELVVTGAVSLLERLAMLLDCTGALEASMQLGRVDLGRSVGIMTYHRIAEFDDGDPFDPEVVDATPGQFRRQMETLMRLGTPISLDMLLRALDGAPLPPNPFMVTFDDGYRSCREVALPIVRALGIPATVFIASAFADGGRLYWWEQIAAILHRARGRRAMLSYPVTVRIDAADPGSGRLLDNIVKNTPGLDLDGFLAHLRAELGVPWDGAVEAQLAARLIMGWDDIRALASAGVEIQSHTRTHRVLETLDDRALREELTGSRQDIEAALGRPVRALAYPVGRRPSARVRRAVADAGYRIALTNTGGVSRLWPAILRAAWPAARSIDRYDVHRLPADRTLSDAMFLMRIALPRLAHDWQGGR